MTKLKSDMDIALKAEQRTAELNGKLLSTIKKLKDKLAMIQYAEDKKLKKRIGQLEYAVEEVLQTHNMLYDEHYDLMAWRENHIVTMEILQKALEG